MAIASLVATSLFLLAVFDLALGVPPWMGMSGGAGWAMADLIKADRRVWIVDRGRTVGISLDLGSRTPWGGFPGVAVWDGRFDVWVADLRPCSNGVVLVGFVLDRRDWVVDRGRLTSDGGREPGVMGWRQQSQHWCPILVTVLGDNEVGCTGGYGSQVSRSEWWRRDNAGEHGGKTSDGLRRTGGAARDVSIAIGDAGLGLDSTSGGDDWGEVAIDDGVGNGCRDGRDGCGGGGWCGGNAVVSIAPLKLWMDWANWALECFVGFFLGLTGLGSGNPSLLWVRMEWVFMTHSIV